MKGLTLTLATLLIIACILPTTSKAQTHRLLSQIEETKLGNNIWDKVTVMLPNNGYTLNKVSYENNTILVLFDYAKLNKGKATYFTFNLSDYKIDCQQVSAKTAFQVIAKPKESILRGFDCPPNCVIETGNNSVLGDFRCPASCPFDKTKK